MNHFIFGSQRDLGIFINLHLGTCVVLEVVLYLCGQLLREGMDMGKSLEHESSCTIEVVGWWKIEALRRDRQ